MDIKEIEKVLEAALESPDSFQKKNDYEAAVTDYLDKNKSNDEIITIVVKGIDIDRAANYYDFIESRSAKEIQEIWREISKNKTIGKLPKNGLKFLCGLLSLAFMKAGNVEAICGNIISGIVSVGSRVSTDLFSSVFLDYVVADISPDIVLPKWDTIKTSEKTIGEFADMLLGIHGDKNSSGLPKIRNWAAVGKRFANERMRVKEIESKIPKSHVDELMTIAKHYQDVEKQVRDDEYHIAELNDFVESLHKQIAAIQKEKSDLEQRIVNLQAEIEEKQKKLDQANNEVDQHAAINGAFNALKQNDEKSLLEDIANDLKSEYQDFIDSKDDEMDKELGEIYRQKVAHIFKILSNKGIIVG